MPCAHVSCTAWRMRRSKYTVCVSPFQGGGFGTQGMLKEGTKHMSGLEEATYKNIEAAKLLSSCVRTSLGPNGETHPRPRPWAWPWAGNLGGPRPRSST